VLENALLGGLGSLVWEIEGFALAERFDEAASRYVGLVLPGDRPEPTSLSDSWLIVSPGVAAAQRTEETRPRPAEPTTNGSESPTTDPAPPGGGEVPTVQPPIVPAPGQAVLTRYFAAARLDPERYGRDFARIQQEVLQHLSASPGTRLEVTIEIQAVNTEGFTTETVRTVRENAATLRFHSNGFEET
jgi:hypothetical protein